MKFYCPRPWFIKVHVPATEFAANGVREGALLLPETGAILQFLLDILLVLDWYYGKDANE